MKESTRTIRLTYVELLAVLAGLHRENMHTHPDSADAQTLESAGAKVTRAIQSFGGRAL